MTGWIVIAIVYIFFGVISYGLVFYYFQERFRCFAWPNRRTYRLVSVLAAVFGPIGLFYRWILGYGDRDRIPWRLRFRTIAPEANWSDFHQQWPNLSRSEWVNHGR